jgi:hypothetical protein
MKFRNWVDTHGHTLLAKKLKLHKFTIAAWFRKNAATPRVGTMLALVKMGQGAFTLEDIIKETKGVKS